MLGGSPSSRPAVVVTAAGTFGAVADAQAAFATVTTSPVQRGVLSTSPDIAFNLTAVAPASAARWVVMQVASAGQRLNFTEESSSSLWHSLLVEAPSLGWIPPQTPVFSERTVPLRIVLACDSTVVLTVDLLVPAPGTPRDFAERVVAATKYSQLASVLAGGATSGSALGRAMATRSMVMCDADSAVGGGVFDLGLGNCLEDGATDDARSGVLSNFVLVGCVATFLLLLALLWAYMRGCPLAVALRAMSLPSTLLPVCIVVLPSTSASVTLLAARLGRSPCVLTDVALALSGAVLVLLPPGCLFAMYFMHVFGAHPAWACMRRPQPTGSTSVSGNVVFVLLRGAFRRRWEWRTTDGGGLPTPDGGAIKHAWVVLLEYRLVWYGALDSSMLAAVAALAVAGGLDPSNPTLCRAGTTMVIALIIVQLVVLGIVRPFTTLFSFIHALLCLSLTLLSVAAQLSFVELSSVDSPSLWLAQLSAACDLAVVGVSGVRILFDMSEAVAAVRRRLGQLHQAAAPLTLLTVDEPQTLLEGDGVGNNNVPRADLGDAAHPPMAAEDDALQEVELSFWDAAGGAILPTVAEHNDDDTVNDLLALPLNTHHGYLKL